MNRRIGYARVSTDDQLLSLQLEALEGAGCGPIFTDTITGSAAERPGLDALLAEVGPGDMVVVWRLDRLGRSVHHLFELAERFRKSGIGLKSLIDGVDTTSSTGRLIYGILGSLAEYERELIRERVTAGMASARRRGVHLGRPKALRPAQIAHAQELRNQGRSYADIASVLGVDKATVWRALNGSEA